jgi:hypothetical protein
MVTSSKERQALRRKREAQRMLSQDAKGKGKSSPRDALLKMIAAEKKLKAGAKGK